MSAKLRSIIVLAIIIVSLIPVYWLNSYLGKKLQPKQSFGRLFLYLVVASLLIFIYTFLIVALIRKLFVNS